MISQPPFRARAPMAFRVLWSLAALAVAPFIAISAAASPYSLCATLLDSSQPNRTMVFDCAGSESQPDPGAVSVTLSSGTFGSFEGVASASSDALDTVRLYASVELKDYRAGSFAPTGPGGGTYPAASARAGFGDFVTVNGPPQLVTMQLTFGVSGTLVWDRFVGQLCYGFPLGGGNLQYGVCVVSDVLPAQLTLTSQPIAANTPVWLNHWFEAIVYGVDVGYPDPYSSTAAADLAHTLTFDELLILGADGRPLPGISVTSAAGLDYPLSPLNQAPVPETATALLWLAGGIMLAARRRRRPQPN